MNLKPFLIGGLVAFFITRKNTTSKSKTTDDKSKVFIRPGYTITDCKVITINDKEKALKQAFKYGLNYQFPTDVDDCLFGGGKCRLNLEIKDSQTSEFFYNLSLYYLAGAVSLDKLKIEDFSGGLNVNRSNFEDIGVDTSKWLTEKDIPQIIEKNK